jgi:type VI secretion system protein ImpM
MNALAAGPAGWYGKLACLGDFASRRLPAEFIARWDAWLQQMIVVSREKLGDAWLEVYLTSPVWHFVEWPNAADGTVAQLHIGVLMPSVDKVGRYFPLCVATSLQSLPARENDWTLLLDWLDRIEAAALETLDTRRSAQQFDDALIATPAPVAAGAIGRSARTVLDMLRGQAGPLVQDTPAPDNGMLETLLIELGAQALEQSARGASLWWSGTASRNSRPLVACPGLPDGASFTAMLRATVPGGVRPP